MKQQKTSSYLIMAIFLLFYSTCFAQSWDKELLEVGKNFASKSGYNLVALYMDEKGQIYAIHGSVNLGPNGIVMNDKDIFLNTGIRSFDFNDFELQPGEYLVINNKTPEKSKNPLSAK